MNNNSIIDKKRTRSKKSFCLSIDHNIEAKFFIINDNKCSKLLIGITDNVTFEIKNIYAINLLNGEKISTENGNEKFMENNIEKEENMCVYIMIKGKELLFKINDGEYKHAFDLIKDEYWFYAEKYDIENSMSNKIQELSNINNMNSDLISEEFLCKFKFIYVKKI